MADVVHQKLSFLMRVLVEIGLMTIGADIFFLALVL
jgi:hypothetical protein